MGHAYWIAVFAVALRGRDPLSGQFQSDLARNAADARLMSDAPMRCRIVHIHGIASSFSGYRADQSTGQTLCRSDRIRADHHAVSIPPTGDLAVRAPLR